MAEKKLKEHFGILKLSRDATEIILKDNFVIQEIAGFDNGSLTTEHIDYRTGDAHHNSINNFLFSLIVNDDKFIYKDVDQSIFPLRGANSSYISLHNPIKLPVPYFCPKGSKIKIEFKITNPANWKTSEYNWHLLLYGYYTDKLLTLKHRPIIYPISISTSEIEGTTETLKTDTEVTHIWAGERSETTIEGTTYLIWSDDLSNNANILFPNGKLLISENSPTHNWLGSRVYPYRLKFPVKIPAGNYITVHTVESNASILRRWIVFMGKQKI